MHRTDTNQVIQHLLTAISIRVDIRGAVEGVVVV